MDNEETSLEAYFASKSLHPSEDLHAISHALHSIQTHSVTRLTLHPLKTRHVSPSVDPLTTKHQLLLAKRQEKDLKDRLSHVTREITQLQRQPSAPVRRNRDKQTSRDSSAEENRVNLLKKLRKESSERQKKLQLSLDIRREKLENEEKIERNNALESIKRRKEAVISEITQKRSAEIHRKSELKRQKLESDRKIKELKSSKPLFSVMEDLYRNNVLLPETLKAQQVLTKHKPLVSLQEIVKHSREVEAREMREEIRRREIKAKKRAEMNNFAHNLRFFRPKVADVIAEEAENERQKLLQKAENGKEFREKQRNYSQIIREMINSRPLIQSTKSLLRQSRSVLSTRSVSKAVLSDYRPVVAVRPKKSRSTQSLQEEKREGRKDYLVEMRERRERSASSRLDYHEGKWRDLLNSSSSPSHLSQVHQEAIRLESIARSHEAKLHSLATWKDTLDTQTTVSSLYLDAIKAKLAVLTAI